MSASKINIIGKNWPWSFLSIKTVKDCVSWCFFLVNLVEGAILFITSKHALQPNHCMLFIRLFVKPVFTILETLFTNSAPHQSNSDLVWWIFVHVDIKSRRIYFAFFSESHNLKITLQNIKPKALNNFKGQVIKGQFLTVKVLF